MSLIEINFHRLSRCYMNLNTNSLFRKTVIVKCDLISFIMCRMGWLGRDSQDNMPEGLRQWDL